MLGKDRFISDQKTEPGHQRNFTNGSPSPMYRGSLQPQLAVGYPMSDKLSKFSFIGWIDRVPWGVLAIPAAFLTFAPFVPEPHLWQKLKMLVTGTLSKPIDIFDLCMHSTPLFLIIIKGLRLAAKRAVEHP